MNLVATSTEVNARVGPTSVNTHTQVSLLAGTDTPRGPMIIAVADRKATIVVAVAVVVLSAQVLAIDVGLLDPHNRDAARKIDVALIRSTFLSMTIPRAAV